jgi:hypothetical protein
MIYQYRQPSCHLRNYVRDYVLAHFVIDATKMCPLSLFLQNHKAGFIFYKRFSYCTQSFFIIY